VKLAAGLLRPSAGRVVNRSARTAVVFQEPRLLPWRDAIDNAAFGLHAAGIGRAERRRRAAEVLRMLGLGAADAGKFPAALSGGMRQRVAIARALAIEPELLLLDEPFAALDVVLRRELQDLVRDLIERLRLSAVLVTHDLLEAVRIADRIAVLGGTPGRVVYERRYERGAAEDGDASAYEEAAALLREPQVAAAFSSRRA
jgi:NitT/TauT family transport system ATP-binding protein